MQDVRADLHFNVDGGETGHAEVSDMTKNLTIYFDSRGECGQSARVRNGVTAEKR